jgi:hypothetical protein
MSDSLRMIAPGANPALQATASAARPVPALSTVDGLRLAPTSSEWFDRSQHYAVAAVAKAEQAHQRTIEQRLAKPSRHWTSGEVVRTYRADEDGERRFREEADLLTLHGYRGWLETERIGHPNGGRVLVGASLGTFADTGRWRRAGSRTVTWVQPVGLN